MAKYSIFFFCDECAEVHPLGLDMVLPDGPAEKSSIGDVYAGKDLPESIAVFSNNSTICPRTGRMTSQKDNKQIFLVPVG